MTAVPYVIENPLDPSLFNASIKVGGASGVPVSKEGTNILVIVVIAAIVLAILCLIAWHLTEEQTEQEQGLVEHF